MKQMQGKYIYVLTFHASRLARLDKQDYWTSLPTGSFLPYLVIQINLITR
jgi:hypothetical protein